MSLSLFLFIVVPLVIVIAIVWGAVRYFRRREDAVKEAVATGEVEALRYHVPTGQDPAAIMAALQTAGYDAMPATAGVTQDLLIVARNGGRVDRAAVRHVIEHDADLNLEGDPSPTDSARFADE